MMKRLNKLFVTIFCLCTLAFAGKTMAQTYDPVAVTVINNLIDNNGLTGYAKDAPETWDFAFWSESEPFQLIELDFYSVDIFDLTGAVSFAGLAELTYLDCYGNSITALDLSGCVKLEFLDCSDNLLTELDMFGFVNLEYLDCYENSLSQLNVSGCINLESLDCEDNKLTELDLSDLKKLVGLYCYDNQLTELDVSNCVYLETFICADNYLTELNVSKNINLVDLICVRNKLTELDASNLKDLEILYCYDNNLTQLNVSGCRSLESLDCEDNHLIHLDLTGLNYLDDFSGGDQTTVHTLYKKNTSEYITYLTLNNPNFNKNDVISYSNGILTSTDKTVLSSKFSVQTGKSGFDLSGTMYFAYSEEPAGVEQLTMDNGQLRVFPNPAKNELRITNYELQENDVYIQIYSVVGQLLNNYQFSIVNSQLIIDISHLAAGMYYLKIDNRIAKFVKE